MLKINYLIRLSKNITLIVAMVEDNKFKDSSGDSG